MSRLSDLLKHHEMGWLKTGGINEEFSILLVKELKAKDEEIKNKIKELNVRAKTVEFLGEQLMTIKAENALLKQEFRNKRVN